MQPNKIECPGCGCLNAYREASCWKCKRPISEEERNEAVRAFQEANAFELLPESERIPIVLSKARETGDWSGVPDSYLREAARNIILTTGPMLYSHSIEREICILTAEVSYGMNIFKDMLKGLRDIVGGRSKTVEKNLNDSRQAALLELKMSAVKVGADAIIAVDLDYMEIGSDNTGMMVVVASGTAVSVNR